MDPDLPIQKNEVMARVFLREFLKKDWESLNAQSKPPLLLTCIAPHTKKWIECLKLPFWIFRHPPCSPPPPSPKKEEALLAWGQKRPTLLSSVFIVRHKAGQPKICNLAAEAFRHQDIGSPQVTMDIVFLLQEGHSFCYLCGQKGDTHHILLCCISTLAFLPSTQVKCNSLPFPWILTTILL